MGWSSGGCRIMDAVIVAVSEYVHVEADREKIYIGIIPALEAQDWDSQSECLGGDPAYDAALRTLHPTWFEDP